MTSFLYGMIEARKLTRINGTMAAPAADATPSGGAHCRERMPEPRAMPADAHEEGVTPRRPPKILRADTNAATLEATTSR